MRKADIIAAAAILACLLASAPAWAAEGAAPGADDAAPQAAAASEQAPDPYELIAATIDQTRGLSSYTEMRMRVHRPGWERSSSLVAWTRGRADALIRFTAPAKDAGNATLKQGEKMWTYTPKLNRVVRLPFSLMSQSWAGSDFSYNDLSRTDQLLHSYQLALVGVAEADGHRAYSIEAIPRDDAPVVWGKELWVVRDDHILLSQTFYDQEFQPLKRMETLDIKRLGGRLMPARMRMSKLDEPDRYTELEYLQAEFDVQLEDRIFTTFSLRSGDALRSGSAQQSGGRRG